MQDKIRIINFTDPVCTWCWGTEPIFRAFDTHFPDLIEIEYMMCGLVEDMKNFDDDDNGIHTADENSFNKAIAEHWKEATLKHKMPVDPDNFRLFSDDHPSTYPQNIAYKAARMAADKSTADRFLYNIRLFAAAKAALVSHEDVLAELAEDSGIDKQIFLKYFHDGSAEKAFYQDMEFAVHKQVFVYPTFLVSYGDREKILSGYIEYPTFVKLFDELSRGKIRPRKVKYRDELLLDLIRKNKRITAEEVRAAFDFNGIKEVEILTDPLLKNGVLKRFDAGSGWGLMLARDEHKKNIK